jgi:flagellar hook assembly protein FlgD
MYIPYGVGSGRLGDGATAVQEVQASGLPSSYSLGAAYPNPFNPDTTIEFALPADDFVKIHVFNTAGQFITRLVDESLSAGAYKTTWSGRDELGEPVASGVYFYRMQAGAFTATHSATLLK